MAVGVIESLGSVAQGLIDTFGYPGLVFGMTLESINVPLPSEALMTFAGGGVASGQFSFWPVVLAGAVGNVIGSVGNYYLGRYGGRPLLEKYGKYILIHRKDLETADRWFAKYGLWAVFVTRILPIIRTFISFPAGVARVPIGPFIGLTFLGSLIWCTFLTYLGFEFGRNYDSTIRPYVQKFDLLIAAVLVLGIVWYVKRHLGLRKKHG